MKRYWWLVYVLIFSAAGAVPTGDARGEYHHGRAVSFQPL